MNPIFMVKRKDGKTDNVYECDFKLGSFVGGAQNYSYEDIVEFLNIPAEIISIVAGFSKTKIVEAKKASGEHGDEQE